MKTKIAKLMGSAVLLGAAFGLGGNTALAADSNNEFRIGPDYTNAPELKAREGVPKGTVHAFTMDSADSQIYPGLKGPYHRGVWVYVPSQYVAGTPAPFIVAQDGKGYTNRLPVILDNMIHDHRLPVMIAVMIQSGGGDGKGSERGLEYDTVSDKYSTFIETEVLPRIAKDYHVTFTKDPEGRATMGGSSGAACAFTMAWFRPDLYRRVLSYSGTYVDQESPVNPASPHGAWEYHEHFIPQSAPKPIRIWMEVGEKDIGYQRDEASLHNWVMANDRMAAALKAKGYQYRYVFCENAGHVDRKAVGETLPSALSWLWEGYAPR
ncbi:MAG TPA: alpha/beta hydrolase-fold protein [Candidatus Saccharimonadales bacterium]|nr:alpha/beta hydrolase-fold protein [Candidatus Saccharimonadales bacterium]